MLNQEITQSDAIPERPVAGEGGWEEMDLRDIGRIIGGLALDRRDFAADRLVDNPETDDGRSAEQLLDDMELQDEILSHLHGPVLGGIIGSEEDMKAWREANKTLWDAFTDARDKSAADWVEWDKRTNNEADFRDWLDERNDEPEDVTVDIMSETTESKEAPKVTADAKSEKVRGPVKVNDMQLRISDRLLHYFIDMGVLTERNKPTDDQAAEYDLDQEVLALSGVKAKDANPALLSPDKLVALMISVAYRQQAMPGQTAQPIVFGGGTAVAAMAA